MTGRWFNSLRVQIMLLLTIALFPLAAVAIYQTDRVEKESARNKELALLGLTRNVAKEEELHIQSALGLAQFFGVVATTYTDDIEFCITHLQRFVASNERYDFVGVLPPSGIISCSSSGGQIDVSTRPDFDELMQAQQRSIVVQRPDPQSGELVLSILEPFEKEGEFAGFISVSVPHEVSNQLGETLEDLKLVELLTIDKSGEVLIARFNPETAAVELPTGPDFDKLRGKRGRAINALNQKGEHRIYTAAPIGGSPATVLAIWKADGGLAGGGSKYIKPVVFPTLMLLASMAVAALSIYTLVLRHISRLRQNMDDFAKKRIVPPPTSAVGMPNELMDLAHNFKHMTDEIMHEEAKLEDLVREKNVLIKEVHHRVKNNLQLISSIMNMKIRTAEHDETRSVLMRLQDRILSLATIHKDLYQSQHGGRVDVGSLLAEIVEKSAEVGIHEDEAIVIKTDLDHVLLFPDQAVPLSLLVAEGMTNALKNIGGTNAQKRFIHVSLKQNEDDCALIIRNSIGAVPDEEQTGLGAQLIKAFAMQLGGEIDVAKSENTYTLSLRFQYVNFTPDAPDF